MKEIYLFVRPYYGVNIHTDAQGEYGCVLHSNDVFPDLPVINSATILNDSSDYQAVILDAYAEGRILPDELISRVSSTDFDKLVIKTTTATVKSDLELIRQIKLARPGCYVITAGQTSADLKTWITANTDIDQVITEPMDKYFYRLVYGTDGTLEVFGQPFDGEVIYTGMVDELFGFAHGELPYRSVRMDFASMPGTYHQPAATVNYPNNYDFTRITEFRQIHPCESKATTILREYPQPYVRGENTAYYPIFTDEAKAAYAQYAEAAKAYPHLHLIGRLAEYRYYDMDDAARRALDLAQELNREVYTS